MTTYEYIVHQRERQENDYNTDVPPSSQREKKKVQSSPILKEGRGVDWDQNVKLGGCEEIYARGKKEIYSSNPDLYGIPPKNLWIRQHLNYQFVFSRFAIKILDCITWIIRQDFLYIMRLYYDDISPKCELETKCHLSS